MGNITFSHRRKTRLARKILLYESASHSASAKAMFRRRVLFCLKEGYIATDM